jgi:hypothetical protein
VANVRIEYDKVAIGQLLSESEMHQLLRSIGEQVAAEAQATADDAQNGPGGRIDGYAQAGFTVDVVARGKRPRVDIRSNASPETALAAHFHSQRKNGVGHLRAALYKFTR